MSQPSALASLPNRSADGLDLLFSIIGSIWRVTPQASTCDCKVRPRKLRLTLSGDPPGKI